MDVGSESSELLCRGIAPRKARGEGGTVKVTADGPPSGPVSFSRGGTVEVLESKEVEAGSSDGWAKGFCGGTRSP